MPTFRTAQQICDHGFAPNEQLPALEAVAARYAVALPPALADLIDPNDPHDPIARQFVPDAAELDHRPQELSDPIGDDAHSPVEGIVHRYPDRVLLKLTPICAVYCRFCFRRETVGPGKATAWSAPARLTAELVRAIKVKGKPTYVALHINHPRELTAAARAACARMADAGLVLLGQSVLLAGVNDTPQVMGDLMRALVECRIKPYYLHHGDLAPGTAHLRTDIATGQDLMRSLRGRLSGLCQPTYVLDIPAGYGKSPIGPDYLARTGSNGAAHFVVEDFNGRRHRYPPAG